MKINWRSMLILFTISVLVLGGCSASTKVSAEEIIHQAIEAEEEIDTFFGEAEMKLFENGEMIDHFILEQYVADGKNKSITKGLLTMDEVEALNDGKKVVMYDKTNKTAFEMDLAGMEGIPSQNPKDQLKAIMDFMDGTHSIELVGEEKVLDFDTYHIKVKANEADSLLGDMELWVEKKTWFIVKMTSQTGDIQTELEYKELDFSPKFDGNTFSINIPEDIEIASLDEDFGADTVTLDEAEEALGQPFYVFAEENMLLSSVQMYDFKNSLNRFEVELAYSSEEGIPMIILSVFPTHEGTEIEEGKLEVRGNKAQYEEIIDAIFWDEDGLRYSLLITNPDVNKEEVIEWAEDMILSSEL